MPATQPVFPIVDGQYKMPAEPLVRIGVILAEDAKHEVLFRLPRGRYTLSHDGLDIDLEGPSSQFYRVEVVAGQLQILDPHGNTLFAKVDRLSLVPEAAAEPKKGDGVLVKDIVAGRGFHWNKLHDQTLTGRLHFQSSAGSVVMVNELPIEEYLTGVITGEMSGECPIEFLKAQTVAARSWLLAQPRPPHPGQPFIWCNDDCCQRYQGTGGWSERAEQAVRETRGQVLITASDHYCDARYSKNTGGVSEDAANVWNETIEGLHAVVDAPKGSKAWEFFPVTEDNIVEFLTGEWLKDCDCYASPTVVSEDEVGRYLGRVDERGSYFRWTVEVTQEDLRESLTRRAGIDDLAEVVDLVPVRRGRSGRLNLLDVDYLDKDGKRAVRRIETEYNIRAAMSVRFLYSGCFLISPHRDAAGRLLKVTLRGGGWGHGAGLCQMGGLGRAVKGQKYDEILMAYYQNVRLEGIY